jgi:hypothetical protein
MKLLCCLSMLFGFPYFCCMLEWLWIGCDRSCTALNLIDEISSNCQWSQPLSLVLVLVLAGWRVNIRSRSCSDPLQGNKLNIFFVSDCEWSQPLPFVIVLISAGQRVNIWSRSCSDLLQGNKLNTFVSLARINYKILIWLEIHCC